MLNEFIKKNIFKFQYDNTLSTDKESSSSSEEVFKFQYDNTLRNAWQKLMSKLIIFKFQYDNTLRSKPFTTYMSM